MTTSQRSVLGLAIVCAVLAFVLGIIIGHFAIPKNNSQDDVSKEPNDNECLDIAKMLYDEVNRTILEDNLRILTERPHIAGQDIDEKDLVKFVSDSFQQSGLEVEIHPYEVLLSYPNETDSNYVSILTREGEEVFKSQPNEKILDASQSSNNVVNPFNAYSPAGESEGEIVYVNYARVEDFQLLERNLSVDTKGKICIARYGKIFRADKVTHAEKAGCIGLILYSDPKEYTVVGKGVYPDDWYLPGTGAQRGTVARVEGDPETPNYPSIATAWRSPEDKIQLPKIPVTPIGYDDALPFLSQMSGPEVPGAWQGGLNITYRLGPGFTGIHENSTIKMHVNTRNERKTTHNVVGYIRGTIEPDRYVIYGAHRDAWVYGSIDPSSAQSILLELARVFGNAVKNGWEPRRTIMLCSWGAEEYGLVGSTEWVQEFQKNLAARAVVYINADTAIVGSYSFYAGSVPSLTDLVFNVTASLPNPNQEEVEAGRTTIYDTWRRRIPANFRDPNTKPLVRQLGSGSDYTSFLQIPGVSVMDFAYAYDITTGIDFYPVYHSVYETFDYMKKFIDPDFIYHQTLARVMAEIGRRLIDDVILPMNMKDYANMLTTHVDNTIDNYGTSMTGNGINLDEIRQAVMDFSLVANDFHRRMEAVNISNILEVRYMNDQMIQLERSFIDGLGVGGKSSYKHTIYAPSQHNRYSSTAFPGLIDSMFDIDADPNQEERWEEVRRQYSIIIYHIGSATSTLRDFTPMRGASNP